jgi:hypothetical protein
MKTSVLDYVKSVFPICIKIGFVLGLVIGAYSVYNYL